MALIFGGITAFAIVGGDIAMFAPTTQFGLFISIGALLALVAFLDGIFVVKKQVNKVVQLTEESMKSPGPPSPVLQKAMMKVRTGGGIALILLIAVLVCMVAAAS